LSQNLVFSKDRPVPVSDVRIEEVGVNPLDHRRVDVAIDLTPCLQPVTVRLAIVGPDDGEWASTVLLQNRESALDRIIHLRRDAVPGEYILHVGVFDDEALICHTAKHYQYAQSGPGLD
jgi:hypothetical protein